MSTYYGTDTFCLNDIGWTDVLVTDPKTLIAQRLFRRLQTDRGALALIGDDPDFGLNVRQFLNGQQSPAAAALIERSVQQECLKDEQVDGVNVTVTFVGASLSIALAVVSSAGPFTLTLNVAQLTTEAIFNSFQGGAP